MSSLVCAWLAERELYIQFTFYLVILISYEHVLGVVVISARTQTSILVSSDNISFCRCSCF